MRISDWSSDVCSSDLDTGKVEIVVVSTQQEPNDYACFQSLGIDPLAKRYLMLKSRVHWRAGFKPIAKAIVDCAGVGVCTSDYSMLEFKKEIGSASYRVRVCE